MSVEVGISVWAGKEKLMSLTRDGVNGSDFVGVFLGELETFSKKEKPVLSHKGDGSPRCRRFLLPVATGFGLEEFMRVTKVPLPAAQPTELSVLSCRRVVYPAWLCLGGVAISDRSKLATSLHATGSCRAKHIYSRSLIHS